MAQGLSTVRSVSFGPAPDAVMLSDPEPGVAGSDCLLWDGAGFDDSGALLTETIAPRDFSVVLFGAGHVGAALVRVLATLPCHCRLGRRTRRAVSAAAQFAARANVTIDPNDAPDEAIDASAAPNTYFIVMTHNHTVDLELAERILRRGDFAFFGMIGSHTKRKQFEHRLAARGIDPVAIARMKCPIGVDGIVDKSPEIIAICSGSPSAAGGERSACPRVIADRWRDDHPRPYFQALKQRMNPTLADKIARAPKAELHIHIEGSLEPELIFAARANATA